MNKFTVLLIVLSCSFGISQSLAQNTKESLKEPIEKLRVIVKHTGKNHLSNPKKEVESSDTVFVTIVFNILDWSKASKIHLKLGDISKEDKKVSLIIEPAKPNFGLPKGVSYTTQRNTVYITLGAQSDMKTYLASIVAEDKTGKKSKELKVEKN